MARIRAIIDFDVGAYSGSAELGHSQEIIADSIHDMLHKLVRPENVKSNRIYYATATYEIKSNRYLFSQNDPEEDKDDSG